MSTKNTPFWTPGTGKSIQENKHLSPSGCHLCPSAFFYWILQLPELDVGRCEVSRLVINDCNSFLKWLFLPLLTLTKPNHSYPQQEKSNWEVFSNSRTILLRHTHVGNGSVCTFYWLKMKKKIQMSTDRCPDKMWYTHTAEQHSALKRSP